MRETEKTLGAHPFPYTVSTRDPAAVSVNVLDSIQQVPSMAQEVAKLISVPPTPLGQ
jgi:hypothetical protein